jgi:crotonobetainyl-CoA:carnitine CoA-transferase CaiB-like acyl-CoA transferase
MLVKVDEVCQVRSPIRLDGMGLPVHSTPPGLGEHTGDILRQLGWSDDEVRSMRESGAI